VDVEPKMDKTKFELAVSAIHRAIQVVRPRPRPNEEPRTAVYGSGERGGGGRESDREMKR